MIAFVMMICFFLTAIGWLYEAYKATEKQVEEKKIKKIRRNYNIDVR